MDFYIRRLRVRAHGRFPSAYTPLPPPITSPILMSISWAQTTKRPCNFTI
ncbi:MAG: hypothetical protein WBO48_17415 [Candidatus Promineifilaceae bacterium]|nr:hypothetical protein [Chloroflexota bacterium]MBK7915494.1 hypothetical protein [Chloroflexota bacterium]